jgi:hypothetical protein
MYILIRLKLVQEVHMYVLIWAGDFGAGGYGLLYGMIIIGRLCHT